MSPRHHKCWEVLSPPSVEEPPSVGDGGYLAINGVWMGWAVYKNSHGYMANCIFSEGWQEREALALALDTILLATRCTPQPWKLLIFFILKIVKKCWAVV